MHRRLKMEISIEQMNDPYPPYLGIHNALSGCSPAGLPDLRATLVTPIEQDHLLSTRGFHATTVQVEAMTKTDADPVIIGTGVDITDLDAEQNHASLQILAATTYFLGPIEEDDRNIKQHSSDSSLQMFTLEKKWDLIPISSDENDYSEEMAAAELSLG